MTLAALTERWKVFGERICLVHGSEQWTYSALLVKVTELSECLKGAHVRAGSVVALRGAPMPVHIAFCTALAEVNAIAVPMCHAHPSKVERFTSLANVSHVAQVAPDGRLGIVATGLPLVNPVLTQFVQRQEAGLVLFTSGSTGLPRAILHSVHRTLQQYAERGKAWRTLGFLLLDHMGGLNTAMYTLANGGTLVMPLTRRIDDICALVEKHRIELLPATPTCLRLMLATGAAERYNLSSLTTITYGTEVMSEDTLSRLRQAFPGVRLKQTYGLSELGVFKSRSEAPSSVWISVGGGACETKVVNHVLWVKTQTAMVGYLEGPSPFDSEGWFNTGDVVQCRDDLLKIVGRASEVINVGGDKVWPIEIEEVIRRVDSVEDCVVQAEPHAVLGQIVKAFVVSRGDTDRDIVRAQIARACSALLPGAAVPRRVEFVAALPVSDRFKTIRSQPTDGADRNPPSTCGL